MPVSRKATAGCFLEAAHSRTRRLRELVPSLKTPAASACAPWAPALISSQARMNTPKATEIRPKLHRHHHRLLSRLNTQGPSESPLYPARCIS